VLDPLEHLASVHLGKIQVEQNQVWHMALQVVQRLGAIAGDVYVVPELGAAQRVQRQLDVVGIVLDEQHFDGRGPRIATPGRANFTISSQNSSMEPTTLRNWSRSTGLVTYA